MAAFNIRVTVADPDLLIAGDSPFAPFVVEGVQVYRWTTEALARAGSAAAGTLVTTFTLVASTTTLTEDEGPFNFQYYDSSQADSSWYRYRFVSAGLVQSSPFSDPWRPSVAPTNTLRDILFEIGTLLGEAAERGTATAGSATSCTCVAVFQSSLMLDNYYKGHWFIVLTDAGGAAAAPEGEEALIASNVASTGVVTLDRTLTAAIASGDVFMTSAYIRPSEMIRCVNRAREGMKLLTSTDIATHSRERMYPAPTGIKTSADIYEVLGITELGTETNGVTETPVRYHLTNRNGQIWLNLNDDSFQFPFIRVVYEQSYRDAEGALSAMASTTAAPLQWLRAAAAAECMKILVRDDISQGEFMGIQNSIDQELAIATGRYATRMPARVAKASGRMPIGPVNQ